MKIVMHFDILTNGDKIAEGDVELMAEGGEDLTPLYDESRDTISYDALKTRMFLPPQFDICNVELRLMSGKKTLKHKPLGNCAESTNNGTENEHRPTTDNSQD